MPQSRSQGSPQWQQDTSGQFFYYRADTDCVVYRNGRSVPRPAHVPRSFYMSEASSDISQQPLPQKSGAHPRPSGPVEDSAEDESGEDDDEDEDGGDSDDDKQLVLQKGKHRMVVASPQVDTGRPPNYSMTGSALSEQLQKINFGGRNNTYNITVNSSIHSHQQAMAIQKDYHAAPEVAKQSQKRTALPVRSSAPRSFSSPASTGDAFSFQAEIRGRIFAGQYDTAADGNFVALSVVQLTGLTGQLRSIDNSEDHSFKGLGDKPVCPKYLIQLDWRIVGGRSYRETCYVVQDFSHELLLGKQFISDNNILTLTHNRGAYPMRRDPPKVKQDDPSARQNKEYEARTLRDGGRLLEVQGQRMIVSAEDLRWAQYWHNAYRGFLGRRMAPPEALQSLIAQHAGQNPGSTPDQSRPYIMKMLAIAQAAGTS